MNFKITLIIGNRGTGKTGTFIRQIVPEYIARRKGQFKIGVFDLEDNYNYQQFECLSDSHFAAGRKKILTDHVYTPVPIKTREQFSKVLKGMVRVLPQGENAGDFTRVALKDIVYNQSINNCLIAIEDSARFMPDNNGLDSSLRDLIINCKQRSMDVVLMFHFWSDVPPKLIKWIDEIYLHKCDESATKRKKDIAEIKLEKILTAEHRVQANRNRYYFERITLN